MAQKIKIIRACTASNSIGFIKPFIDELIERYDVTVVASPGRHWSMLDAWGNRVGRYEVPMQRHISPIKDLKSLWNLWRVFRHEKPTMVHSMTPKAGLLCMLAAWMARVPVRVHTFTGLVFPTATGLTKRILMATDWLTCACATHIIPEGEGVKNDLLNHGITRKPIRVLGHGSCRGIDANRFKREPEDINADCKSKPFTYLYVGRLVKDKGINELIEAFEQLNKLYPDTRLILVGYKEQNLDPIRPDTFNKIENNPAIEAVGQQSDVRPWYAQADAFVFPSYREGFPNVVLEAGAMSLPSIVTDINGSREIIKHGVNGLIVRPRDVASLYEAMLTILEDKELRNSMANAARPIVTSKYGVEIVHTSLLNFYNEILDTL